MALKVIELLVDESLTGETRVEEIALVLQPAIETEFIYFGKQKFQDSYNDYPESAKNNACKVLRWREEHGDEVKGMTQVGWTRANQLCKGENISLDTIGRMSGFQRHRQNSEINPDFKGTPWKDAGYVAWLGWGGTEGIEWASRKLEQVREKMGYDVSNLSPWSQTSGTTETFEKPCWDGYVMVGMKIVNGREVPNCVPEREGLSEIEGCGCGCWDDGTYPYPKDTMYFEDIMINGVPVFPTIEEAEQYAETMGCEGTHKHIIDGKEYYMPCEVHPEEMCGCGYNSDSVEEYPVMFNEEFIQDYDEEDFEVMKAFQVLKDTDYEKFEAVVIGMNGRTEQEIYRRNHTTPKTYFRYERVLQGQPDRDFCTSIEGRYFTRPEIDILKDVNSEFGHNRQPYSKWLYKGGPNCVHAWRKFLFQGKDKVDQGMAQGTAGIPPKSMDNQGYYSAETKRRSEVAYIISQQEMNRQSSSVIIVDVDDTLLKGGSPIEKTKEYINEKHKTHRIVVVSGRQKSEEGNTRRQLERSGIKFDEIYLSDFPVGPNSSRAFKEYKAKWLMDKGLKIVEAIDNDSQTRRDYTKLGIKSVSPSSLQSFKRQEFALDNEKRMIYSPAMKPGILIPRIDEQTMERYFVTFKPETIERMSQRYMIDKRSGGGHTNYEHSDLKFEDVYLVESWIVDGEQDKAYSLGFTKEQVPKGTWMVGFRCDSDEVWEMVKNGEIKGISIEGNFEYKFSSTNTDEYLLKEIINIINQIK